MTILVIVNEPAIRSELTKVLVDAGYRVCNAADGVEALEMIAREQPALVVTELCIPRLDGCSLAARLIQAGNWVPLLMISAGLREPPLSTVHLLPKPLDMTQLLSTVANILAEPALDVD